MLFGDTLKFKYTVDRVNIVDSAVVT